MRIIGWSSDVCSSDLTAAPALARDDRDGRYDQYGRNAREWKRESRDGPCEVKRERKGRDSLLEVKCTAGIGARWRGEWKEAVREDRESVMRGRRVTGSVDLEGRGHV